MGQMVDEGKDNLPYDFPVIGDVITVDVREEVSVSLDSSFFINRCGKWIIV